MTRVDRIVSKLLGTSEEDITVGMLQRAHLHGINTLLLDGCIVFHGNDADIADAERIARKCAPYNESGLLHPYGGSI